MCKMCMNVQRFDKLIKMGVSSEGKYIIYFMHFTHLHIYIFMLPLFIYFSAVCEYHLHYHSLHIKKKKTYFG